MVEMLIGGVGDESFEQLVQRKISVGDISVLSEARQYANRVSYVDVTVWTADSELQALSASTLQ